MKKILFHLILVAVAIAIAGCQYVEAPTEVAIPPTSNQLMLKVNGETITADSVNLERGVNVIFQITLPRLKTAVTTFHDNGVSVSGAIVAHVFGFTVEKSSFTVVATDSNNAVYERTVQVKLGYSLPMYYAFGKNQVGSKWEYKIVFLKTPLDQYSGAYGYVGNITDPTWINHPLDPNDTNKVLKNGQVSDAPVGERGLYAMVSLAPLSPGNYTIAFYKGNVWGPYGDSNKVKFTIATNGELTFEKPQPTTTELPGDIGDWSVRFGLLDSTKIVIFVNNAANFLNSYFIRMQDNAGVFQQPVAQSSVPDNPNWGKIELSRGAIPSSGTLKLSFNYGSNINQPLAFNAKASESTFYYPPERVIKVVIQKIDPLKSGSKNTALKWVVERG